MPVPKKSANRRQGRGTNDVGLVEVRDRRPVPPPPTPLGADLRPEVVEAWEAFWRSDMAQLVQEADMPALRRLFEAYDDRLWAHAIYRDTPIVDGSRGQPRLHPAAGELHQLNSEIERLERAFGLTPKGRLELGVVFGAAARSLEELNAEFEGEDDGDEDDPRLRVVDG